VFIPICEILNAIFSIVQRGWSWRMVCRVAWDNRFRSLPTSALPCESVRCTRRDVAQGVCFCQRVQPWPTRSIFVRTAIIRYAPSPWG